METWNFAIIPHKDQLLLLSQLQKKILCLYNSTKPENTPTAFPSYPLWFNSEFDFLSTNTKFSACSVSEIFYKNNSIYFKLSTTINAEEKSFEVPIATRVDQTFFNLLISNSEFQKLQCENIPLKLRVFRVGKILQQKNSMQLFEDKWISVK